jgi:hypothetical protein
MQKNFNLNDRKPMTPHLLLVAPKHCEGGPRVRSSLLRLHPWTPWIWGILDFRSIEEKQKEETLDHAKIIAHC